MQFKQEYKNYQDEIEQYASYKCVYTLVNIAMYIVHTYFIKFFMVTIYGYIPNLMWLANSYSMWHGGFCLGLWAYILRKS